MCRSCRSDVFVLQRVRSLSGLFRLYEALVMKVLALAFYVVSVKVNISRSGRIASIYLFRISDVVHKIE